MFIDRLTFDEIDKVLEKVLNVVFNDEKVIDYIMTTKTTAIIGKIVEISFKWGEELYAITLDDFNVDFPFYVKAQELAKLQYRIAMGKIFSEKRRSVKNYLTKLDEYEKDKWHKELSKIADGVAEEKEDLYNI